MARMNRPEQAEQIALIQWCQYHPVARRIFHVANGGKRSKIEAGILKAMGVRSGVLDLQLPVRVGDVSALWIEMKASTGSLEPSQFDEGIQLRSQGCAVIVAYSAEAAIWAITAYLDGLIRACFTEIKMINGAAKLSQPKAPKGALLSY